ncbi:unnamed protein product [Linum trigynum]|uniref:Uncharacterized protein n=1 Tax=Linum trigynum TaxID=586398 RepID=A0AAV2G767_9ROSI
MNFSVLCVLGGRPEKGKTISPISDSEKLSLSSLYSRRRSPFSLDRHRSSLSSPPSWPSSLSRLSNQSTTGVPLHPADHRHFKSPPRPLLSPMKQTALENQGVVVIASFSPPRPRRRSPKEVPSVEGTASFSFELRYV